jgi:hypothetical protein
MPLDAATKPKSAKPALPVLKTAAVRATEKTAAIADAFGEIGRVNGTMMPDAGNAKDPLWWEYWVASVLAGLSDARRERAKKALVAAGKLPDYAAHPLAVGAAETIYASALLSAGVKVTAQADRVDVAAVVADLVAKGVEARLLKRTVKRHTKSFNGAHIITAMLVAG